MAVPRNNLNELLAKVSTTPTTRATNVQAPGSNTGKSKFKPAASRASPSIPSSVAVHKTTSYTSFSTPGFGKTKPAPPLTPSNTHAAPSSSSQSSATLDAQPSANAHSSASKRTSPASFSAIDPPSKRSRPSTEPDKENFVDSDTQIIDITQAEDSGYISFRDKGKGRDTSSATFSRSTAVTSSVASIQRPATSAVSQNNASANTSYTSGAGSSTAMTVSKPSPLHISTSSTGGSSRIFSFDYGDLLTMSSNELEIHKTDLLDARGQIMDLRGQADKPMAAILRKFESSF
ncbi:hypothetical protein BC629DRAFT_1028682 [Irpex lacteus]|nr:hypothetical protein BC629DRAFT_1028682 [Irpex lacteus]